MGIVFQAYVLGDDGVSRPYGSFYSSYSAAFGVVRALRSVGHVANVRTISPYYSI